MALPLIPIIVAAQLLSLGSKYMKGRKQEEFAEEIKKKVEKQAKRRALAAAVGAQDISYKPMPEPPNLWGYDMVSGLGDIAGQYGAMSMATPGYGAASKAPGFAGALSRRAGGGAGGRAGLLRGVR